MDSSTAPHASRNVWNSCTMADQPQPSENRFCKISDSPIVRPVSNWADVRIKHGTDKFCLASANTHRHACRCTCVPVLLRLRAYRRLYPPRQRRPQLTLPSRISSRPVRPHCRTRGPLAKNCRGTPSNPANTATLATAPKPF